MGGARVTTLVTLRKCTLGNKRVIKTLKFVLATTKGFKGGLAWIKPSKKDMAVTFSYSGPTACALAGWRCSLWGWQKGVPGGGALHCCEGRLRSGAPPPPTARPLGMLLGSATLMLWARACGCGGPTLSPWPACPVGAACRGVGGGPSPGGVACHRCEGCLVSGAVPPLAPCPVGRAAGVPRPVCSGCVWCGRGDPAPAPRRTPLRAGVARRGGGGRVSPGGGAVRRCEGRLGSGAPPHPAARPLGELSGSATHVLWARVCRRGGPAPAPWPACPVGGCAPRGWRGASGFRRPLFPAARPLGRLPGPAGRVPRVRVWVCVVCVVPVRCMPWCWVLPFACFSGAPASGALLRCCAPRVLAVPPSLRASLARLLATSRFFCGFVVLYPFPCPPLAHPPRWHAPFPCLHPGVCLGPSPCLLPWPRLSGPLLSLLLGPARQGEDWGVWAY